MNDTATLKFKGPEGARNIPEAGRVVRDGTIKCPKVLAEKLCAQDSSSWEIVKKKTKKEANNG